MNSKQLTILWLFAFISMHFIEGVKKRTMILNALMDQPGWRSFLDVQTRFNEEMISLNHILKHQHEGLVITDSNEVEYVKIISGILSCKYSTTVSELMRLADTLFRHCKLSNKINMMVLCTTYAINGVLTYNKMIVRMLNALSYFYRMYADVIFDHQPVYNAMITLNLYARDTANDKSLRAENLHFHSANKFLNKSLRVHVSVENFLQQFMLKSCTLDDNMFNWVEKYIKTCVDTSNRTRTLNHMDLASCITEGIGYFSKESIKNQYHSLGFPSPVSLEFSSMLVDLNCIRYVFRRQYFIGTSQIQMRWYGEIRDVDDIMTEITSNYLIWDLAYYQLLTCSAIVEIFFLKTQYLVLACISDVQTCNVGFWSKFKKILKQLRSLTFPTTVDRSLETLDELLFDTVDNDDVVCILPIVQEFLRFKLDTARIVLNANEYVNTVTVGSGLNVAANDLQWLETYVAEIWSIEKPIKNISFSCNTMWDDICGDVVRLLEIEKPADKDSNYMVDRVCKFCESFVAYFVLNEAMAYYRFVKIDGVKYFLMLIKLKKWFKNLLRNIQEMVMSEMRDNPKAENVNVRRALVLMTLFANNCNWTELIKKQVVTQSSLSKTDKCIKLATFITNEFEKYMLANCVTHSYRKHLWNAVLVEEFDLKANLFQKYNVAFEEIKTDISNLLSTNQSIRLTNSRGIDLDVITLKSLVDQTNTDLSFVGDLKSPWNGTNKTIRTIRNEVIGDINATTIFAYQRLLLKAVTAVVLCDLLEILKVATRNECVSMDSKNISITISCIDEFVQVVFPVSKLDYPEEIFSMFHLFLNEKDNSLFRYKAKFLEKQIQRKLNEYNIKLSETACRTFRVEDEVSLFVFERINSIKNIIKGLKDFTEEFYSLEQSVVI